MATCRGLRGATTATANDREAILEATREMLQRIMERNHLVADDIAAAFFTVSDDLNAEYPALAARQLGWTETALMCAREIPVPTTTVERCIRVLMLINTEKKASEIIHVYLRAAVALRPSRADISVEEARADSDATEEKGD
jgi:chorismate mutase